MEWLTSRWLRMWDWLLPEAIQACSEQVARQAKLLVGLSIILSISGIPFVFDSLRIGRPGLAAMNFLGVSVGLVPLILRWTQAIHVLSQIVLAVLASALMMMSIGTNGLFSTALIWSTGLPLLAVMLVGIRSGIGWSLVCFGIYTYFYVTAGEQAMLVGHVPPADLQLDQYVSLAGFNVLVLLCSWAYESSRQSAWEELQIAQRQADEANEAKSQFLATMSHEMRTPLNAVLGYTEILEEELEERDEGELIEDVERIRSAGERLLNLINSLLDLSKIEAGKMELVKESFSLKGLCRELEDLSLPLVKPNENTFTWELEDPSLCLFNDRVRLCQVLLNLLSNACKFTEQGSISLWVGVVVDDGQEQVCFRLRDEGIGMTPEQLASVFREYEQAESTTSRRFGGTGLGLALSRAFCELMGGSIRAESEEGVGSTFFVYLPRE